MFDEQEKRGPELTAELAAVERQLRGLTLASPRIDRDRLMFAAGQAAQARPEWPGYLAGPSRRSESPAATWAGARRWFWPAAAATMTAATLLLATMLVWQNRPQVAAVQTAKPQAVAQVVNRTGENNADDEGRFAARWIWPMIPTESSGYLGVRYIALTRGLNEFPDQLQSPSGGRDRPVEEYRTKPATERDLLDELLPHSARSMKSRS